MRVAVIGAGPAGLTAAYQLVKSGHCVDVYEATDSVGGLSKTIELWGQKVDTGPHRFFSTDSRVNELWLEVLGQDYAMVDRLTRILYQNKFFYYPLKPLDALGKLGPWESLRCMVSYLREKGAPTPGDASFENWVTGRFGRRLFEIFFKTYSEKLWGISCQDLDADFAAQRIKNLSFSEVVKNAFSRERQTDHKTLVDRFAYPKGGAGQVYERMAEAILSSGNRVLLNRPVRRLVGEPGRVTGIECADGTLLPYDHVVSTFPLSVMVKTLAGVPADVVDAANALTFRNTLLVYLHVDGKDLFPDNWLYIHSPQLQVGRVTNFRNWVPNLYGEAKTTILALEYWCFDKDAIWSEDEARTIDRAATEMRATGLLGSARVLEGKILRIPRSYPVYQRGYKTHVEKIARFLKGVQNCTVIGRYGSFKYNNQDHSILMGLLAAENIALGKQHDLWAINTDYESYQERSRITETGLEREEMSILQATEKWKPQKVA